MWYSRDSKEIEYTKPIVAESKDGVKYLLVPTLGSDGYSVVGYDWLNIETGEHSSCRHWETALAAIGAYCSCEVYNVEIELKRI